MWLGVGGRGRRGGEAAGPPAERLAPASVLVLRVRARWGRADERRQRAPDLVAALHRRDAHQRVRHRRAPRGAQPAARHRRLLQLLRRRHGRSRRRLAPVQGAAEGARVRGGGARARWSTPPRRRGAGRSGGAALGRVRQGAAGTGGGGAALRDARGNGGGRRGCCHGARRPPGRRGGSRHPCSRRGRRRRAGAVQGCALVSGGKAASRFGGGVSAVVRPNLGAPPRCAIYREGGKREEGATWSKSNPQVACAGTGPVLSSWAGGWKSRWSNWFGRNLESWTSLLVGCAFWPKGG